MLPQAFMLPDTAEEKLSFYWSIGCGNGLSHLFLAPGSPVFENACRHYCWCEKALKLSHEKRGNTPDEGWVKKMWD